jgi:hypothetical protein
VLNKNQVRGLIIYPLGDLIAQLILGEVNFYRTGIFAIVGCFIYSFEIGKWFGYLEKKIKNPFLKTGLAVLYFNPLWIARHFLFIELALHPNLFTTGAGFLELLINAIQAGSRSFAGAILISFLANYLIQNRVPLKNRFLFSAVFSALMGIYYALSKVWF